MLSRRPALRRYLSYYRESRGRIALGIVLALIRALLVIPVPLLVGRAIDQAIPDRDTPALLQYGGLILGLSVAGAAASMATRYVTVTAIRRAMRRLRDDAVDKLFSVSRHYYTTTEPSVLHDQIVQESSRVNSGSSAVLEQYVPGAALIVGLGVVLIRMNATLALVTLGFGPVIVIIGRLLGRSVRVRVRAQHRSFERYSRSVLRALRAMDLIRTHGAEERESALLSERAEDLERAGIGRAMWTNAYSVSQATLLVVTATTVLILGGWFVIRGTMSLGELISFYAGFALLRGPLGGIAQTAPAVIEGMQSLEHLEQLLGEPDVRPYSGTLEVDPATIVVEDVTFAYEEEPVVVDVSFALERGRVTAIHGPNGSGKSTLVNLVLGFYRPDRGIVRVNDIPYDEVDMTHHRRMMGVVPQQPILLQGTVADNVAYGREGATREDVLEALRLAQADFVHGLPDGVDTDVGGEGVFLSGGQRQRIAIARALVHRPDILILDEPTNHLDRQTITSVIRALASLRPRPAVLLISHQAEVLAGVDHVIELKEGRVVVGGS